MLKIVMYKGLPACGKSTHAKALLQSEPGVYKRVNKDDLRSMIDASRWSKSNEAFVLDLRDHIVRQSLQNGKSVLVDDTNFNPVHEQRLRQIAQELRAEFQIQDFSDIPLETCLERDRERVNSVGPRIILDMYDKYLKPAIVPVERLSGLPSAVMSDLDGTLAILGDRSPYDAAQCHLDTPCQPVLEVLRRLPTEWEIILMSGRSEEHRIQTESWLKQHEIAYSDLFMRPTGDTRPDDIVKEELYWHHIHGRFNVEFIFDDRGRVVRKWRSMGFFVFDCNQSGKEF